MKIDIIIPLYKPGKELFSLLDRLNQQTVSVQKIILMNTEQKYFEQLVYGTKSLDKYKNVKVYHLSKREFDHAGPLPLFERQYAAEGEEFAQIEVHPVAFAIYILSPKS